MWSRGKKKNTKMMMVVAVTTNTMMMIRIMKNIIKMSLVNQNLCLAMMRALSCGLVNGFELYGDDLIEREPGT